MVLLAEQVASGEPSMPWLVPLITIATLLLGGGGIAAYYKVRVDKQLGVAQQESVEDDALSSRWRSIIETQTKVLLEPMKVELAEVKAEVKELRQENEATKRKYWSAISYIRNLLMWIGRHLPDDLEITQVPPPPVSLAEDI